MEVGLGWGFVAMAIPSLSRVAASAASAATGAAEPRLNSEGMPDHMQQLRSAPLNIYNLSGKKGEVKPHTKVSRPPDLLGAIAGMAIVRVDIHLGFRV